MALTVDERKINELTSFQYTGTLKDETDTVIPLADLTTLTLTIYNLATLAVINSRSHQDIKNTNGGTFHATSGLLTMVFAPDDSPIIDGDLDFGEWEEHVALFEWTWDSGAKGGNHQITLYVVNLGKVGTGL